MPAPGFGALLKHYRLIAQLTQEELAERAQLSRLTVSSLERGVRQAPHRDTVWRLAGALELAEADRARLEAAGRGAGHRTALAHGSGHLSAPRSSIPFTGRCHELSVLQRHVEGNGPPLLLLAGEPGIGKTRLLHEAAAFAASYGLRVLRSGARRSRHKEPYAPIDQALARHVRSLTAGQQSDVARRFPWLTVLLPELADDLSGRLPLPTARRQRLVFEAVAEYLTSPEAGTGLGSLGTLLVLDDLQWAGAGAVELLGFLAQWAGGTAADPGLRLVGTYRSTEMGPEHPLSTLIADLAPGELATQLPVGPLPPEEAEVLAASLLAETDQQAIDRTLQRGEGVPFLLVSYAQALRAGTDGVPLDVARSVQSRVAALPPDAREFLEVVAAIGPTVPHDLLTVVSRQPEESIIGALKSARCAGLIAENGSCHSRFTHDVIREVMEQDLGSAYRALLRRRAAEAADGSQCRPEQV